MSDSASNVEGTTDRKGVYVVIKATGVKIIGEKGTKVPNLSMRDLHVMVDIKMEILQLEHKFSGTSVPIPKTLLKYILNIILPSLVKNRLRALLPIELGQYFLKQTCPGVQLGGKLVVVGPQMTSLDADLVTPQASGSLTKKQARQVAAAYSARSMLGLSLPQCQALSDLLCAKQTCVLPLPLERITFATLCAMQMAFAQHPDLLQRWNKAIAFAVDSLFQGAHEYFTRAAHTEAERDGGATLTTQLDSLNELHGWLFSRVQSFKRRFKSTRGSLLASVDPSAFSCFLEDVLYQGPLHVELPMKTKQHSDGSLSFSIRVPATLANRRSVISDMLRTLIDSQATTLPDDKRYLHDADVAMARSSSRGGPQGGDGAGPQLHPLLGSGPNVVAKEGDKLSLGHLQVNSMALKMILEQDLMEAMLKGALTGPITADSLARMLQCFGPCFHLGLSNTALLTHNRELDSGERSPGIVIRTGEVCNALASIESIGYASEVSPLRMVRFFHTGLVSAAVQGKAYVPPAVVKLDRLFHTVARYVGSESLDVSLSLQFSMRNIDDMLQVQLFGNAPPSADEGSSCCVSFSNDIDMATILESIDIGQGTTPVGRK